MTESMTAWTFIFGCVAVAPCVAVMVLCVVMLVQELRKLRK